MINRPSHNRLIASWKKARPLGNPEGSSERGRAAGVRVRVAEVEDDGFSLALRSNQAWKAETEHQHHSACRGMEVGNTKASSLLRHIFLSALLFWL